jgi:hypothetical protein
MIEMGFCGYEEKWWVCKEHAKWVWLIYDDEEGSATTLIPLFCEGDRQDKTRLKTVTPNKEGSQNVL